MGNLLSHDYIHIHLLGIERWLKAEMSVGQSAKELTVQCKGLFDVSDVSLGGRVMSHQSSTLILQATAGGF